MGFKRGIFMRRLSMSIAAALVLGTLVVPMTPALATTVGAEAPSAGPADAQHAESESQARAIAAQYGHAVVVDDQSTPNLLVKAKADGFMEAVSSQVPEQVNVGGEWKKVDTSLVAKDGWLEPKAAAVGVKISAGGTDELVKVQTASGDWVTEVWPYGALPTPNVSKSSAVFPEVLPGVDLKVNATKAGMREVLVVKNEEAAADERLSALKFTIRDATLSEHPDTGTLAASPADGSPVVASTPLWWDSSHDSADSEGPGGGEAKALDVQAVSSTESVLDVGAVTNTEVTYPLYVDPDWSGYLQYDWYTDRAYPNQAYLNPPENSVGYGIQSGVGYLSRAFYRFDTSFLAGKLIQNARFNVVQTWANSCASTQTQLWQYGQSGVGFTWNSDPAQWNRAIDSQAYNTGGPCSTAPGWVGFAATPAIQDAANAGAGYQTLALRAADESNSLTRKHFRWDAQLIVTYNSRPNTPTSLEMTSPVRGCSTDGNNPAYVNHSSGITLKAIVTDPDAGQATAANFYVKKLSDGTVKAYSSTFQGQGANLTKTIGASDFADNTKYAWQARGSDNIQDSSAFTAWCYFNTDATKPALPTASLDATGARVGSPLTVTITPPANEAIAGYQVWWTQGAKPDTSPSAPAINANALPACNVDSTATVRVICANPDGTATLQTTPIASRSTIWVAAYDRAGNPSFDPSSSSTAAGVEVTAEGPDLSLGHVWSADSVGSSVLIDRVGTSNITIRGNSWWDATDQEDPPLGFQNLVLLKQYYKGLNAPVNETDPSKVPSGYDKGTALAWLLPYRADVPAPANTQLLYACNYGSGNMISLSATCEGTGATSRPLGYSLKASGSFSTVSLWRCRFSNPIAFAIAPNPCSYLPTATRDASLGYGLHPTFTPSSSADGIVDTTKSFTVSARVRPTVNGGTQTIVSASGSANSAFSLQIVNGAWKFCVRSQGATAKTGCVDGPPVTYSSEYVTVSGIWDAVNKQLRLAVFGNVFTISSATYAPPSDDVRATGAIVLGSATVDAARAQFFDGYIADVSLYPTALPDVMLRQIPVPQP